MVSPALQVRVPNPANALLQAEQIRDARAVTAERARQGQVRNQLLSAIQEAGGIPTDPAAQNALVNQIAVIDPQTAFSLRQQFAPPSPVSLGPGQSLVNPRTGESVASIPAAAPRPVAVSPGQSLIDPTTGATVASFPAAPPTPSQFDQRVSELRARGFSDQEAQDIAAGRVRVSTNPVTGDTQLVNVATGQSGQITGTGGPVITAEERGRLFNQNASIDRVLGLSEGLEESAASASGPRGNIGALVNSLAGLLGRNAPLPADEIAAARQDIRLFNQIAKTAIVNNPRFPVAEQQVVERMLPNADDFFTNPSNEFNKVLQLQQFLRDLQAGNNSSLGVAPGSPLTTAPEIFNPSTGEVMILQDGRWVPK